MPQGQMNETLERLPLLGDLEMTGCTRRRVGGGG